MDPMFSIARLYSDASGDSRFQGINIPLMDRGKVGKQILFAFRA
jgi:hypothetical protein